MNNTSAVLRHRYQNDALFYNLVNSIAAGLDVGHFTPRDVEDALRLAVLKNERDRLVRLGRDVEVLEFNGPIGKAIGPMLCETIGTVPHCEETDDGG